MISTPGVLKSSNSDMSLYNVKSLKYFCCWSFDKSQITLIQEYIISTFPAL